MTVDSRREAEPIVRGIVMLKWKPTTRAEVRSKHERGFEHRGGVPYLQVLICACQPPSIR